MASIWTIGDIHGQALALEALLDALPRESGDTTIFLGDYIDRGPDSAAVVTRVLAELDRNPLRTVLLEGNHERMAAEFYAFDSPSRDATYALDFWRENGGDATLNSFRIPPEQWASAPCPAVLKRLFSLQKLYYRTGHPDLHNYVWVHAGVLPGHEPEETDSEELLWIRDPFFEQQDTSGRVVVFGHTPSVDGLPWVFADKIGIDTGIAYGGRLSALQLPERNYWQVDAQGCLTRGKLSKE